MSELRIVRGRDIGVYVDSEPLFGMISFSAKEKRSYHTVHEFLSSSPVEKVPQETSHEIKLEVMSLFGEQIPSGTTFTLRLVGDGEEFIYHLCRVTEVNQEVKGGGSAEQVYTITADSFERRVLDDE